MTHAGIDVAKDHPDLGLHGGEGPAHRRFATDAAGIAALAAALAEAAPALVALEATGAYHRPALAALLAAGLPVALVNPAPLKAFREARLGRQKTDREDALLLARFAAVHADALRPAAAADETRARRRAAMAYRDGRVAEATRLKNRRHAADWAGDAAVRAWLAADLGAVEARLAEVDAAVGRLLDELPEAGVLVAQPGVGRLVAAAVLAYLPAGVLGRAKAAAAYAGLHPRLEQSGQRERSRLAKQGDPRLRRYLYLAALAALRHDPELRAFYDRPLGRGKPKPSAICAVMHKLLRRLMGRLRAAALPAEQPLPA